VKEDVREVRAGLECGLKIEDFNDVHVGDVIEVYEIVEVARVLT
jgi:translation initiation factor IF-2